jgi:hypothetical protein
MTVTLSREDAAALKAAARAERVAKEDLEFEMARAKVRLLEACRAKNAIIERCAQAYGFDPDVPFDFDAATGELRQGVPSTGPG